MQPTKSRLAAISILGCLLAGMALTGCTDREEQQNAERMQKALDQQRGAMKAGGGVPSAGSPPPTTGG